MTVKIVGIPCAWIHILQNVLRKNTGIHVADKRGIRLFQFHNNRLVIRCGNAGYAVCAAFLVRFGSDDGDDTAVRAALVGRCRQRG